MPKTYVANTTDNVTAGNTAAKVIGRLLERKTKKAISPITSKEKRFRSKAFRAKRDNSLMARRILGLTTENIPARVRFEKLRQSASLKTAQHVASAVGKIIEEKNPFANKDGSPKYGKEIEFFEWAEKNWNSHLDTLTLEEKEKHIAAAISLSKKMNF